ncbi:MAG: aldose 1-epimerase [Proteobacteria bacterium]|nr:aldose 1-epimerase [Pseudomonadota bacterium]MBS0610321.1 aldose 1-epimerase [Pseudomonadota bacterium]
MHTVELHIGEMRLALRPDLGGCIAGLWRHGLPVLRSTEPAALSGPRASASFPLLPYSNRLGLRRFHWRGAEYTTAPNFEGSPHSLHGVGWLHAWQVDAQDGQSALLSYHHRPDAHWPFAFVARQHIALGASGLHMHLALTNTDAREQPVGLGWHPYFPRRACSRLQMAVNARWDSDAQQLPTHSVPQAGLDAPIETLAYDHCFTGWSGTAIITDECLELHLGSTLRYAVVFTPTGRDYFCVEPVSHANDAIHFDEPTAHGLLALHPGATAEATMALQVQPR